MRIGFISTYPPIECGIATYSQFLIDALRGLRQDVYVVSHLGGSGQQVFPVFDYEDKDLAEKAFSTMMRFSPDVVHIQHEFGLFGKHYGVQVVPLIALFKMNQIPVVATLHTVYREMVHEQHVILQNIVQNANRVIVHENYQKEVLLKNISGIDPQTIHVIEHGAREVQPVQNAKQKIGLPKNKKVILMIGYFRPSKNFEYIVDLFPEIARRVPDAILVLAGKVRGHEYREYRTRLFQRIEDSPLKERIYVIRGQLEQQIFDTIISAADVIVLPYKINSQSGILAHSLAFGKPLVVSNSGSMQHIMQRAQCGLVSRNEKEYVQNITRILTDEKLARQFSQNALKYVKEEISWRKVAEKHLQIYRELSKDPLLESRTIWVE
ncbi:glycosyl transferase group 1 [Caldithrix abyssi DSM 13497]|uniref:Glycosyl transferase group 1 n=1 Tax=Caldithrix abyssi DSM 13497 TaxID=880073 RepID=H1XXH5_CALAY|nr:glycosyltransferase [Caldithrix abyssi]APF19182.1 Glycosyltransferase involved in cell wall bisynthesis [Caldithrix abyssi DSM 13497]EHO43099.1 glycosyl transferase group 1 [Caldithrix abyssi DSM 13497]